MAEHFIEAATRLSRSSLWRLQRAYYDREGVQAWRGGAVPSFITSNAFIARAAAETVLSFVRDLEAAGLAGAAAPLYIIELGAGAGRFGHSFLCKLAALETAWPGAVKPIYVMTDFARGNVEFLRRQPQLRALVEAGRLDFACFDAERDTRLELLESGRRLTPGSSTSPLVVIANYVFDTLSHDTFRIKDGRLHEGLVSLVSTQAEPDLDAPGVLDRIDARYEHRPVEGPYYGDPRLDAILDHYASRLDETSAMMPVGAFTALGALAALSGGQLLVLAADKGYNSEEGLLQRAPPAIIKHGSFSLSVNFDAIGRWFTAAGGLALHTSPRNASLLLSLFAAGIPESVLGRTRLAFQEHIDGFGPTDFFTLHESVRSGDGPRSVGFLIALLRLSGWDPQVVFNFADALAAVIETASGEDKRALRRGLARAGELYLPIGESSDVLFELGRLCSRMEFHGEALAYYERSITTFGDHPATRHNIGLCHFWMGRTAAALDCFEQALALNPDYGPARVWRLKAQAEIGDAPPAAR